LLTRLQVTGFKNLVDVDLHFGPFTCIAGANGVGKSNLFDAVRFLSLLADRSLLEAALAIRDEGSRSGDPGRLFTRLGEGCAQSMVLAAEMLVPPTGVDDLGQAAQATTTFLRYAVELRLREQDHAGLGPLELVREELSYITKGAARASLRFPHARPWRESVVTGKGRRGTHFISTDVDAQGLGTIRVHQDGGSRGQPRSLAAASLPRTALSASQAAEAPTALLARREMQSWRLLQLEPMALRRPDDLHAPARLGADGSHLAATLYRLARASDEGPEWAYGQVAQRLAQLLDDVREVSVDEDARRELRTLIAADRRGRRFDARSLSDGTLRFLALAVLELDPLEQGLICLEEPENGLHPERVPAMLQLLRDIAVDVQESVGADNALRQVVINTHSPAVVQQAPEDALLVASVEETITPAGVRHDRACFRPLSGTWRGNKDAVAKGLLLRYLNPVQRAAAEPGATPALRVVDRPDLQLALPGVAS